MARVWAFVRKVWVVLFGTMSWQAPPWARAVGGRAQKGGRWARAHRGASLGAAALVAALAAGTTFGVRWYKHRPHPLETTVTLTAPEVTRIEEKLRPHPALFEFDGSAAPLKNVEKIR